MWPPPWSHPGLVTLNYRHSTSFWIFVTGVKNSQFFGFMVVAKQIDVQGYKFLWSNFWPMVIYMGKEATYSKTWQPNCMLYQCINPKVLGAWLVGLVCFVNHRFGHAISAYAHGRSQRGGGLGPLDISSRKLCQNDYKSSSSLVLRLQC